MPQKVRVNVSRFAFGVWVLDRCTFTNLGDDAVHLDKGDMVHPLLGRENPTRVAPGEKELDVLEQVGRHGDDAGEPALADKGNAVPGPVDLLGPDRGDFFPTHTAMGHQADYDALTQILTVEN